MEELIQKFNELAAEFSADATAQATKGNKAAGLRARKNALELVNVLKEFRKASMEKAKAWSTIYLNHHPHLENEASMGT